MGGELLGGLAAVTHAIAPDGCKGYSSHTDCVMATELKTLKDLAAGACVGYGVAKLIVDADNLLYRVYRKIKNAFSPAAPAGAEPPSVLLPPTSPRPELDVRQPAPEGAKTCAVCMERTPTRACLPCGHLCLCGPCTARVRDNDNRCPICRRDCVKFQRIYDA